MSICTWCGNSFEPRNNGGKPQRFCSAPWRRDVESACRIWASQEYEVGRLSIFDLRTALYQRARCVQRELPQGPARSTPEGERRSTTLVTVRPPEAACLSSAG